MADSIMITEWALQSYLDLRSAQIFTDTEYRTILRPDALLLLDHPTNPKFGNGKFWGPARDGNKNIHGGWKMKWHQIGNGKVQLRLLIVLEQKQAYLCNAYVKDGAAIDKREMAKLKVKIHSILSGRYTFRGYLS